MPDESTYSLLNDPDMKEIFESFIVETKEILEKLELNLVDLEKNSQDTDLLNDIFRSFHTIKGTSGFLGLEKLTKLTHQAEDILNKLRKSEIFLNNNIMDGILLAFDSIKDLVNHIEISKKEDVDIQNTIVVLERIQSGAEDGNSAKTSVKKIRKSSKKESVKKEHEKSLQIVQEEVEVIEIPEEIVEEPDPEISEIPVEESVPAESTSCIIHSLPLYPACISIPFVVS